MHVRDWIDAHGSIAHRRVLMRAGYGPYQIRRAALEPIGRNWIASDRAPILLRRAAAHGSPLTCVSAAQQLGLSVLEPDDRLHLWRSGHANSRNTAGARIHRTALIGEHLNPLVVPVLDVLAHATTCLPRRDALIIWESALHLRVLSPAALAATRWHSHAARQFTKVVSPLSESPLETALLHGMLELGLPVRQQVRLLGHRVDFLVGERLVIQTDGYEYHRDPRQRRSDIAHDAALRLHDHTVFRFDYVQVVRRWPETAATIMGAVDRGLHR